MKKVVSKQSPPKLFGGCAPPLGALVAMDARAASGGRARAGSRELPHSPVFPGPGGAGPRSQPGRHHEVSKEGVPP